MLRYHILVVLSNERCSTQSEFGHVTCNVFKGKSGHRGVFPFFGQVNCKWLKILHVNLHSTCCMRCAVLLAKVYSGWAMSAMFFDAPWHVNSVLRVEFPEGSFQSNFWQTRAKASAIAPGADEGCVPPVARWTLIISKIKIVKMEGSKRGYFFCRVDMYQEKGLRS